MSFLKTHSNTIFREESTYNQMKNIASSFGWRNSKTKPGSLNNNKHPGHLLNIDYSNWEHINHEGKKIASGLSHE